MKSIATFALILAFGASSVAGDYNKDLIHVVDFEGPKATPASIFFRGSTPVTEKGTVDFVEWYSAMSEVAKLELGAQMAPPEKLYVVDVGFEDPSDVEGLEAFWKNPANKAKGTYYQWPYAGIEQYPADFSPAEQEEYVSNTSIWDKSHMPTRVSAVFKMLVAGPPSGYTQLAIFGHCASGWNKIGTFIDVYRISHFKKIEVSQQSGSLKVVRSGPPAIKSSLTTSTELAPLYALGCREGARCPVKPFTSMVGWYCLWSNKFENTTFVDCSNGYTCAASACLPVM